jgi:hypothetical protein
VNPRKQVKHFAIEIDNVIERFRKEYDMTFAEMIGVLQLEIHTLSAEAFKETKTP